MSRSHHWRAATCVYSTRFGWCVNKKKLTFTFLISSSPNLNPLSLSLSLSLSLFLFQDSPYTSPNGKNPWSPWRRKPPLCTQSLRLSRMERTLHEETEEAGVGKPPSSPTSSGSSEVDSPMMVQDGILYPNHVPSFSPMPRGLFVGPHASKSMVVCVYLPCWLIKTIPCVW